MKISMAMISSTALIVAVLNLITAENAIPNPCGAYEQLEDTVACGEKGYLIAYGLRNCLKFSSPGIQSMFTASGRRFLECTRNCLIVHLQDMFSKHIPSCSAIHESAFDSHVSCYLKCDFCKICKTEKRALLSSYEFSDFLSADGASTIFRILKACGPFSCFF